MSRPGHFFSKVCLLISKWQSTAREVTHYLGKTIVTLLQATCTVFTSINNPCFAIYSCGVAAIGVSSLLHQTEKVCFCLFKGVWHHS